MWLDLQKPGTIQQELIPIMAWHESHTLALSRHTNERAINSLVCFHWHHFCDPVNSWQSTMERAVPLGSNCCRWPYWPDKWTVAVCALQWTHNGCFSSQMYGGTRLWLPIPLHHPPHPLPPPTPPLPPPTPPPSIPYKPNSWYWRGLEKSVWKSSCSIS